MVVILGTLGHHPETLMPTIRSTKRLDQVVAFHSDHEDSIKAVEEIRRTCQMMEVKFSPHPIPDAFDLVSTAMEIQKTIMVMPNRQATNMNRSTTEKRVKFFGVL